MTTIKKSTLLLTSAVAAVMLIALSSRSANAFPAYAKKEGKPCSYCHVNAKGGGPRNAAGIWYKTHGLSLVGFKPGAATPVAPKPKATPAPKKPAKPVAKKPAPKKPAPKKKS